MGLALIISHNCIHEPIKKIFSIFFIKKNCFNCLTRKRTVLQENKPIYKNGTVYKTCESNKWSGRKYLCLDFLYESRLEARCITKVREFFFNFYFVILRTLINVLSYSLFIDNLLDLECEKVRSLFLNVAEVYLDGIVVRNFILKVILLLFFFLFSFRFLDFSLNYNGH